MLSVNHSSPLTELLFQTKNPYWTQMIYLISKQKIDMYHKFLASAYW